MGSTRGSFGEIKVFEDFTHFEDNIAATGVATAIVPGTGYISVGDLGLVSVNEGTLAWVIDEPGGILSITTDTGDDDNTAMLAGRFQPSNGGCEMEVRLKHNTTGSVQLAVEAGFTETLDFTTPVMPAEFDTVTMTYNGSGGMVGAMIDPDATTDDWRAFIGDGGAGGTGSGTTGVRANETIAADEWYIIRTEVDPSGTARVYVGHKGNQLDLVKEFTTAGITPTDQFYAFAMCENRSGAAKVMETDYLYAHGWRDWLNT